MNIKTKIITGVLFLFVVANLSVFAANYSFFEAYGLDAVAGHSTVLRTSKMPTNSSVNFSIEKPSGEVINIPAVTNSNGVAIANLSDYHTKTAGQYKVSVANGKINYFNVSPDQASQTYSVIYPQNQVSKSREAEVSVKLVDKYNNPIEGHLIKLISSSSRDAVRGRSPISNTNGEAIFDVSSDQSQTSTYSAYDVTGDVILDNKAKVVYFASNEQIFSQSDLNKVYFASGNSSGPVSELVFEDVPETISSGENVSLTVTAKDAGGQTVLDYDGNVRFSIESDNSNFVTVPADYTFTPSDQGSHTFSLGFLFQQADIYEILVTDLNDVSIFGSAEFTVVGSGSVSSRLSGDDIQILNPTTGSYSTNVQVITGAAPAGAKLKIFDNDVEIASVVADVSGAFSYTTGLLTDGSHTLYVANVNDVGTIIFASTPVVVEIDTVAAQISQVVVEPSDEVDPGTIVTIRIYIEDELTSAQLILADNVYDMVKQPQEYYEADVAAPIEFGEYPIEFVLTDRLGNESSYKEEASITVGPVNQARLEVEKPGTVQNLDVTSADKKITLNWRAPATVSQHPIMNYRIYYGISPNQLTEAVDTFTAATTWYIPNLQNGVEYYFAVIAVDEMGNTSESFGEIVSATPTPLVMEVLPFDVLSGEAGAEDLEKLDKDVSESGPEMLWLILLAALGGFFYSATAKRKTL